MDYHHFHGKNIPHIEVNPDMKIADLVEIYASSGFNARQLGEAAKLYRKMIEDDATIFFTIAGAMTPVGFGGLFKSLIEKGFVDWIISTGSNLYQKDIVRIRDVYIKGEETLKKQDTIVQKMFENNLLEKPFTTAEFANWMGKYSKEHSKHPERSFVVSAYDYDVPLYISTLKDSSLALYLPPLRLATKPFALD